MSIYDNNNNENVFNKGKQNGIKSKKNAEIEKVNYKI